MTPFVDLLPYGCKVTNLSDFQSHLKPGCYILWWKYGNLCLSKYVRSSLIYFFENSTVIITPVTPNHQAGNLLQQTKPPQPIYVIDPQTVHSLYPELLL